jgi:hypothetical protein
LHYRTAPFVFQQGTVVTQDVDFWMGSIAMDKLGDIALGFSASSDALDPSVEGSATDFSHFLFRVGDSRSG